MSDSAATQEDQFIAAAPSRTLDLIIGGVTLAASVMFVILSLGISSRVDAGGFAPREWPLLLSCLAVFLSLWILVGAFLGEPWDRDDLEAAWRPGWTNLVGTAVVVILYVLAWDAFGYLIPTALFLAALLLIYGVRRPLPLILFPVAVTGGIHLVFHEILRVPL